ncbi:hypothetical protein S40288_01340 [Stachybotrys chartarum IBT 40288]|nr:hypothetical protein S40288_01340 [Stachybotrys chartarum IBT 40288]
MKSIAFLALLAQTAVAQSVVGAADGFAKGVTGGGDATPVYPADIDELTQLLTSSDPQVIVLDKEFDFTESLGGRITETGCAPWGTAPECQLAIDGTGTWCGDNPSVQVSYYEAPTQPIDVQSDKTIIGVGSKGVIKGKGLQFKGVSNVIVQNIHITTLNPEYVWGGDALGFAGAELIWIDHVTTSLVGRQHYVFHFEPSTSITLSNNYIDGQTDWSATCNGYHYWTIKLAGEADQITFMNNYIYHTSGRAPALEGGTLLHAINNVWSDNAGHVLEGDETAKGLFEGNVFESIKTINQDFPGQLFTSPDAATNAECEAALGRACEVNQVTDSDAEAFVGSDTGFFSEFAGLNIASAVAAAEAASSVPQNAGHGKISAADASPAPVETPVTPEEVPEAVEPTAAPTTLVSSIAPVSSTAALPTTLVSSLAPVVSSTAVEVVPTLVPEPTTSVAPPAATEAPATCNKRRRRARHARR